MNLERINKNNQHLFSDAFSLYESAFPKEERRDPDEQKRVMTKDAYHFDLIMNGSEFIGVMLYWETDEFIFLEHFTTIPEIRGKGFGAQALDLLKQKGKTVILEIEDPVDEISKRRLAFYERNGFVLTPHYHIQAKYHLGDDDLMLKILSYNHSISKQEYLKFQDYMTKEIGILPSFNNSITIRPMSKSDDEMQVAKLIYLSDNYIYPGWFDSIEDGQKVLAAMMNLPTIYNKKNITVAVTEEGFIAGATVSCDFPVVMNIKYLYEAFETAGIVCDHRTNQIYLDYYEKMDETEGHYLANIAVDPEFRGQGIATTLLSKLIEGKKLCQLECVQSNISAWRIYQRLGFVIVEEYPGVFNVPCYKMIKNEDN